MLTKRTILFGSPALVAILVLAFWHALVGASTAGVPATTAQEQDFLVLIQKYRRTFFDGWLTGDLSRFPAVF